MIPEPPPVQLLVLGAADDALRALLAADALQVSSTADLIDARRHDAVLLSAPTRQALEDIAHRTDLPQMAFDSAVVVWCPQPDAALEAELLRLGVEAIVVDAAALPRAIRHAVLRKDAERTSRNAYATDLATGLPHQAQLLEHMTQLLALREREPAPMVLLVLRIVGVVGSAAQIGSESANILRRKVAVRLRSGLRASDVVAALGPDAFAVLLGHLESPGDGERVAAKLVRALQQPLVIAGQPCSVSTAVGLALYPAHGKDAQLLLQRASAQAGAVAARGHDGPSGLLHRAGGPAANDDL